MSAPTLKAGMLSESAMQSDAPAETISIPKVPQSALALLQEKFSGPALAPRRRGPQIKNTKL